MERPVLLGGRIPSARTTTTTANAPGGNYCRGAPKQQPQSSSATTTAIPAAPPDARNPAAPLADFAALDFVAGAGRGDSLPFECYDFDKTTAALFATPAAAAADSRAGSAGVPATRRVAGALFQAAGQGGSVWC